MIVPAVKILSPLLLLLAFVARPAARAQQAVTGRTAAAPPASAARLGVAISGLRGTPPRGQVIVVLFDAATAAKGFPDAPARATQVIALDKPAAAAQSPSYLPAPAPAATRVAPAVPPQAVTATVADLPPGAYAVSVFHDENKNNKLDTGPFGIPKEGYGFSRDPRPRFRAPRFDEARFDLPAGSTTITVRMKY